MSKRSYSLDFKLQVVESFNAWEGSTSDFCRRYNISRSTLFHWLKQKNFKGPDGLKESKSWGYYSEDLKLQAVKDYHSGKYSKLQIVEYYDISDSKVLRDWLALYNGHKELKETQRSRSAMTKSRNTTWKERIEIVQDCLSVNKDYQQIAKQYDVSYQQVYSWVKKYEKNGWEALQDGRGRSKSTEELTEDDLTKLEIRRIEKENERLRAENAILKKLKGLEGRDR